MKKSLKVISLLIAVIMILSSLPVSSFATVDGSFVNAASISTNTTYSGNISESKDADFYQFTLSSAGKINISFEHENLFNTKEYWYAVIFDKATNELCHFSFYGTDESITSYSTGLAAGTYYLRITGGNYYSNCSHCYDTTNYKFSLNYSSSSSCEYENSNDSMSGAKSISVNKRYYGSVCDNKDLDFYKFSLSDSGTISINFKHKNLYSTKGYFTISLYKKDTSEIMLQESTGSSTSLTLPTIGLAAGTYYLRITGGNYYSNCSHCYDTTNYSFALEYTKTGTCEKENNENYASASAISLGKNITGSINDSKDIDFYKFNLSKATTVKYSLTHSKINDTDEYWAVKLYNDDTKELSTLSVSGTKNGSNSIKLSKGTYYIRITGGNYYSSCAHSFSTSNYTLNVSQVISVAKPTGLKASSTTKSSTKLSWTKVSGATGYIVYKYSSSTGKYTKLGTTKSASYTVKNLKSGTTYKFAVKAYKTVSGENYYSGYSGLKSVKTK